MSPGGGGRAELRLHVQGMDCADEAALVRHVLAVPGVLDLDFDLVGRRVDVSYDPARIEPEAIVALVGKTGLGVHSHPRGEPVHDDHAQHGHVPPHGFANATWIVLSGAAMLAGWGLEAWSAGSWTEALFGPGASHDHAHDAAPLAAYGLAILFGLWPVIPRAIASLRHLRLDMHVLVMVSALGAAAVGQWAEGAAVASLFGVAHLMEAWSIERARVAVSELVGHEPGWDEGDREVGAARVERFIERFAAVYTPAVTVGALTLVIVPPLFDGEWGTWFYRALIFLVLACPCALVISTPVTVVAALTSAARRGVLFRGGLALERAAADAMAALAAHDVILMPGADADEGRFAGAHARRALGVIRQNVTLALLTKLAFLISAAMGAAPLWLAVLADTGATLAVTINGLRLLRP
ncbi:MAG TPA: cation transporter [Vicinamibacterales bacterium]|nr:cation transporter [Vicinamibacterales bacterium]